MAGRSMSEEEQAAMKRQVKKELKKKLGRKPTKEEVSAEVEVRTLATKSDQAGAAEELVPTKSELKQKQKKEKKDAKKEKKDAKKEKKSKKKKSDVDGAAEPPEAKNTKGKKRKVGEGVEAAVESVEAQSMSVDDSGVAEEQEVSNMITRLTLQALNCASFHRCPLASEHASRTSHSDASKMKRLRWLPSWRTIHTKERLGNLGGEPRWGDDRLILSKPLFLSRRSAVCGPGVVRLTIHFHLPCPRQART